MNNLLPNTRPVRGFHSLPGIVALALILVFSACETSTIVEAEVDHNMDLLAASAPVSEAAAQVNRDLAAARASTAKYHDVQAALDDGFAPMSPCVEEAPGGMGYHYGNESAPLLDPASPQILLYEPQKNGRMRLVGVEYLVPYEVVSEEGPAPSLFDQDFHPTPHVGAWTLHAWVWHHNPAGMFADFNPRVSCQYAE